MKMHVERTNGCESDHEQRSKMAEGPIRQCKIMAKTTRNDDGRRNNKEAGAHEYMEDNLTPTDAVKYSDGVKDTPLLTTNPELIANTDPLVLLPIHSLMLLRTILDKLAFTANLARVDFLGDRCRIRQPIV
jgi:hypothetical protein